MDILGVDLGVRNLGLALMRVEPGKAPRLLRTATIGLPLKTHPDIFTAYFVPRLKPYLQRCDRVGSEALTFFTKKQERVRSARGATPTETFTKIGVVFGILTTLAKGYDLPFRSIQPPALKQIVTGVRKGGKEPMIDAVKALFPDFEDTNHAADAVLAGLACWHPEALVCGGRAVAQ
ncbi:MAG: hypothetical protein H8E31_11540 [Planctomycetes bacterium]|nr:hypothetical protein [Planctomycetota bacterium]